MKRITGLLPYLPLLAVLALPFMASCGGSIAPSQRTDARPDPQHEMDDQEARLRAAEQQLQEGGPACEQRCQAGGSICDAARRICEIASELDDDRSHARCEHASASCLEANDELSACQCTHDVPDAGRAKNSASSILL